MLSFKIMPKVTPDGNLEQCPTVSDPGQVQPGEQVYVQDAGFINFGVQPMNPLLQGLSDISAEADDREDDSMESYNVYG